MYNLNNSETQN